MMGAFKSDVRLLKVTPCPQLLRHFVLEKIIGKAKWKTAVSLYNFWNPEFCTLQCAACYTAHGCSCGVTLWMTVIADEVKSHKIGHQFPMSINLLTSVIMNINYHWSSILSVSQAKNLSLFQIIFVNTAAPD